MGLAHERIGMMMCRQRPRVKEVAGYPYQPVLATMVPPQLGVSCSAAQASAKLAVGMDHIAGADSRRFTYTVQSVQV